MSSRNADHHVNTGNDRQPAGGGSRHPSSRRRRPWGSSHQRAGPVGAEPEAASSGGVSADGKAGQRLLRCLVISRPSENVKREAMSTWLKTPCSNLNASTFPDTLPPHARSMEPNRDRLCPDSIWALIGWSRGAPKIAVRPCRIASVLPVRGVRFRNRGIV